jgi:RNA polymerase sigma-70 factor (ECF subfamily)
MTLAATDIRDDLISVYLRQWQALLMILRRRTGSQELSEEALQETWLRLTRFEGSAPIEDKQAFILRVAGNIAIDLVRKERRHSSRCLSDEMLMTAIADEYPSPEAFAIDRDELRRLALAELPAKPRAALLMNRCDGLSHREIAGKLQVSESMVAKHLARALRHCRDRFRGAT